MGENENSGNHSSFSWLGFYGETAAGTFCRIFEKRYPKSDFPGGPGGEKGICNMGNLFRCHSAAIVFDDHRQPVCFAVGGYADGDQRSSSPRGIFCYVKNI